MSIYDEHIIPILKKAGEGNELWFMSPSTFFGFYSSGVHVFDEVCDNLDQAKDRKCKVKIIVNIRDEMSAIAGKGLESFLKDIKEVRTYANSGDYYFIALISRDTIQDYCKFQSQQARSIKYLPNNSAIPFAKKVESNIRIGNEKDYHRLNGKFHDIWVKASSIKAEINKYDPSYKREIELKNKNFVINFLFLLIGLLSGAIFIGQAPDIQTLRGFFIKSVGAVSIGIVGSLSASKIYEKFWK